MAATRHNSWEFKLTLRMHKLWHRFTESIKRSRTGTAILYYVEGLITKFDQHDALLLSGGLAFSLFICILPLTLVLFAVVGLVISEPVITEQIALVIDRAIPYEETSAYVQRLVFERIEAFTFYKNVSGVLGLLGLLFAGAGLFGSMRTILNKVFHGKSTAPLKSKLRDLRQIFIVLAYLVLAVLVLPAADILVSAVDELTLPGGYSLAFVGRFVTKAVVTGIVFFGYMVLYFTVPKARLSWKAVAISAGTATLLWTLAKELFGWYIRSSQGLAEVYGAYVFLVIAATWIYYASLVFIVGAIIGQLYRERKRLLSPVLSEDNVITD